MHNKRGRRGRPIGYKLSEESKRAISEAKKGQFHRQETKDKISKSLIVYFRNKNPVSVEMIKYYSRLNKGEACEWLGNSREHIDCCDELVTEKTLRNKQKIEITCGANIELFSHSLTPELLVLFKEYATRLGITTDLAYDLLENDEKGSPYSYPPEAINDPVDKDQE